MKYITTEFKTFVKENLHAQIRQRKINDSDATGQSDEPLINELVKELERTWNRDYQEEFEKLFK